MHPYTVMAVAWISVLAWIAFIIFANRKTHPKALFYLFFVEMWERFSYYGMRALFVLYMTSEIVKGGLKYPEAKAYSIYAAYGALVYLTPIIGGLLAERVMGYRKAIYWGAILMAFGHAFMAVDNQVVFFLALSLLIMGNGFFKPNISCLIGSLYSEGDPRRDSGFTIFYMGVNVGAFLTGLTCGTIGELEGWHYGFGLAGIGMVIGLIVFWFAIRSGALKEEGHQPAEMVQRKVFNIPVLTAVYIGTILMAPVIYTFVMHNEVVDIFLGISGIGMVGYMLWLSSTYDIVNRQRIWVIVSLLMFTTLFWTFFELAGSALTVFTAKNIEKNFMGLQLTASNFQSFNPLFIMLFAPVFSWLWIRLAKLKMEPSTPVKFAGGLVLLGLGFLVLQMGRPAITNGMMPAIFIVLLYLLHTWGELAISPIGLSLVTKLSPAKIVGFMMGFWFLSSSIAHQGGKFVANLTAVDESVSAQDSLFKSLDVFNTLGFVAIGCGVGLLLLSPIFKRWMHGVK